VAGIRHHQLRDRYIRKLALDDDGERACSDRIGDEIVPVDMDAGDGEEERVGRDGARVVGERQNLTDRDADHALGTDGVGQCSQSHAHRRNPRSQPRAMPVAVRSL
jgi:hypothetical protein